jgi:hypothetical protein
VFCLSFCPLFQSFLFVLFGLIVFFLFAFSLSKSVCCGFGLLSHVCLTLSFGSHQGLLFMALVNPLHAHRGQFRWSFSYVGFQDQSRGNNASSFVMHQGCKNSALNGSQRKTSVQSAEKVFKPFDGSAAFRHKLHRNI